MYVTDDFTDHAIAFIDEAVTEMDKPPSSPLRCAFASLSVEGVAAAVCDDHPPGKQISVTSRFPFLSGTGTASC